MRSTVNNKEVDQVGHLLYNVRWPTWTVAKMAHRWPSWSTDWPKTDVMSNLGRLVITLTVR